MITFMSKRNQYGHRKFLNVDMENKTINFRDLWIAPPTGAIEIKSKDIHVLAEQFRESGFVDLIKIRG